MDQFIEESKNTLADLVNIKGLALLDPDVKIQKVDPSKRILRWSPTITELFRVSIRIMSFSRIYYKG